MIIMLPLLLLSLAIPNVECGTYLPLECINNYTTFFNAAFNEDNNTIIEFKNQPVDYCSDYCNNLTECTSFTFIPTTISSNSLCLLTSNPYKDLNLYHKFDSVYYLKSNSSCNYFDKNHLWIIFLGCLCVAFVLCCCCYNIGVNKQRKRGYQIIN